MQKTSQTGLVLNHINTQDSVITIISTCPKMNILKSIYLCLLANMVVGLFLMKIL